MGLTDAVTPSPVRQTAYNRTCPMPSTKTMRGFGPNASILLDLLRFGAALAVALTHLPLFTTTKQNGLLPDRAGNTAVCVFFVLSGFVMRYVTVTRVTSARAYCIDRVSRMYSVVLPALLLTVLLEWVAQRHAPSIFLYAAEPIAWRDLLPQMAQNLTFTVGWWDYGTPPLSNGVFWSLSFECVYYALYGLGRYAPRARWVLVPLLLLLVGPSIALLFPIWLLGAALFDVYAHLQARGTGLRASLLCAALYVGMLLALRKQVLSWLRATQVTDRQHALTRFVASFPWGRRTFHGAQLHWLDRFSVSYFITGTLLIALLLPLLLALERFLPAASEAWAGRVRLVADSTFTLYLIHLPTLLVLMCFSHGPWTKQTQAFAALALVLVVSIALAQLFDRLKNAMRAGLRAFP